MFPPKFNIEAKIPIMMVCGYGAFERSSDLKGEALMKEISVFIREPRAPNSSSLPCENMEDSCLQTRKDALTRHSIIQSSDPSLPWIQNGESYTFLFKPPKLWYL